MTVAEYDSAERAAMPYLCNRVIACSKPVTFLHVDYPIVVNEDVEVGRYVDVMQEGRFDRYFEWLHGLTREEFDLFQEINSRVAAFTEESYGKRRVVGAALLSSIHIFRYLRALYPPGSTILELGPGCGYLGALLVMTGYAYLGTDITQAFYIYQNHLLNAVTGGQLVELATDGRALRDITAIAPGSAVHIPWWKYVVPRPSISVSIDCVSPNHVLCEMSNIGLSYNLQLWSALGSEMVFSGWGSQINVPAWLIVKRLSEAGFVFAHNDEAIHALVPQDSAASKGGYRLPNNERTPSEQFINLKNYGESGFERIYRPPIHRSEESAISRRIMEIEKTAQSGSEVGAAEARAFLTDLLGHERLENDDEAFLSYIGHPI